MKLVDLAGLALEATVGAPVVVLREHDEPHRLLPIFVGSPEAAAIALGVAGQEPDRPLTHDLMAALVRSLGGHLEAVEVTELSEGAFMASLRVHSPTGEHRIDTRPSDAIALAVRLGAPVFVSDAVLDEAGTLPLLEVDETIIDDEVDEFRSFLDDVEASHFALDETELDEGGLVPGLSAGDAEAADEVSPISGTPTADPESTDTEGTDAAEDGEDGS